MEFTFNKFTFRIENKKIRLLSYGEFAACDDGIFTEVQVCGEEKPSHMGVKMAKSSEGARLDYVSHELTDKSLKIVQASALVEVCTVFTEYEGSQAVSIRSIIKNISNEDIVLEEASSFVLPGIGTRGIDSANVLYLTKFTQSHHGECQPITRSFHDEGLFRKNSESQARIAFANIGSWSTKEALPEGIIEDRDSGRCIMFQIESNASWYYEIADHNEKYYLWLGGPTLPFGAWSARLAPGEEYSTPQVALAEGDCTHGVIAEMTKYRRAIMPRSIADSDLPTIFNEYMHLSWDSPTEENTRKIAPTVASLGVKYYVIDCGWHNEEPGNEVYPYVGHWLESKARFPSGVRATTDFIRSLGMKAGLWIEPEIVGIKCDSMLKYYDDDCFMQRNGKRIAVMGRYFLDYRSPKVIAYMSETIRRMVEDYGADYIKCDYNQDVGVGTDYLSFTASQGLMECADAFARWIKEMTQKYPNVIFEGCASGGMRMDYKTLSLYPLVSTSDQINYLKYPYIAANILSSVTPEQAAVWSYPVATDKVEPFPHGKDWVVESITKKRVILNMINSFLGRMHLASHLELLSEECLALVNEGVEYYDSLSKIKREAIPCFPLGFARFDDTRVCAGLKTADKLYLAVWCLGGQTDIQIPVKEGISRVKVGYPKAYTAKVTHSKDSIDISFEESDSAIFLEIEF